MKVKLLSKLELKTDQQFGWILTGDFGFSVDEVPRKIPKGFPTDLATIPSFLTRWLPQDGSYAESAVIHDWYLKRMYEGSIDMDRSYAADIFYASMKAQKISLSTRLILLAGVKANDLYHYIKNKVK